MKSDIITTKTKLREAIDSRGIRYSWVAERIGISRPHLHHLMEGHRPMTRDVAQRIADVLAVGLDEIGYEEATDGSAA